MKKKIKKITIRLLVVGAVLASLHVLAALFMGDIHYSHTFKTEYRQTGNDHLMRTSWVELRTNSRLLNIEYHATCPGFVGAFLSTNGLVDYEYGIFAPSFEPDDSEYETYQIQADTVNGYFVQTVEKNGEFGFYISMQKEMKGSLTIYPSTNANELRNELLKAATTADYKVKQAF